MGFLGSIRRYLRQYLFFFGPGLILAIGAAGESGIAEIIEFGSHFGYALLWVVAVTLVFKFAFVNGIARYTLATGETIFYGLSKIPGPKNWEVLFITLIYFMEMTALGGMLYLGAIFLDYLIPGWNSTLFLVLIALSCILIILWSGEYERLELCITLMAVILFCGIAYSLTSFFVPLPAILSGFIPSIPKGSLFDIMALMGTVGAGLNLLLYSVWLHEKTKESHSESNFAKYMRSVNIDLGLAFILVALLCIVFFTMGLVGFSTSYLGPEEMLSFDMITAQILYIVSYIPYGSTVFLLTGFLILFAAVLSGMDGRARAVSSIIRRTTNTSVSERMLYRSVLILFSILIVITATFGDPRTVIHHVAALSSIMFAIIGFMILYLDLTLPLYARGSRTWAAVMICGSSLFLFIALMMEEGILTYGLPMIERLALVAIFFYGLTHTTLFEKIQRSTAGRTDLIWFILIFSGLSMYGVYRGEMIGEAVFNFGELAPMIAGLFAGPVVGGIVGLIGGLFAVYHSGMSPDGLIDGIIMLLAGLIAGYLRLRWKGRITYLRAITIPIIVELIAICILYPLFLLPSFDEIQFFLTHYVLSDVVINIFGLVIFIYIMKHTMKYQYLLREFREFINE
ncbi:MAG: Nramp family divalent metal transporter [Methanospirillaceae archaeon]|nr:Nramp family divalent metal transporter [Methanospirillaceae archaeon]